MGKKETTEEEQSEDTKAAPAVSELAKSTAPVSAGTRKAHWPEGFVPTGDVVEDTKQILKRGPQVMFMVPMSPDDQPGATEIVQINGYKLTILKGSMVEIPVAMAELLAAKYKIEMSLSQKSLLAASSKVKDAVDA